MAEPTQPTVPVVPPPAMDEVNNESIVDRAKELLAKYANPENAGFEQFSRASQGQPALPPGTPTKGDVYVRTLAGQAEELGAQFWDYMKGMAGAAVTGSPTPGGLPDAEPSGVPETRTIPPTQTLSDAWDASKGLPNEAEIKHTLIEKRLNTPLGEPPVTTPPQAFRDDYKPNPLGDVAQVMGTFMMPLMETALLTTEAGMALPDKTSEGHDPTFWSSVGDFGESFASHQTANFLRTAAKAGPLVALEVPALTVHSLYQASQGGPDTTDYGQMGANLYNAFASGDLYRKAMADKTPTAFGDFPTARGTHILDAAVPMALSRKLAAQAATEEGHNIADALNVARPEAVFWEALNTHFGRESVGAAIDTVRDPIWFFGPASGAQRVMHRGVEYEVAEPVLRGSVALAEGAAIPYPIAKTTFIDLVHGDVPQRVEARRTVDRAMAKHSSDYVDAVGRLNVELSQPIPDEALVATLRSEVRTADARYADLQRVTSLVRAGETNGYLTPRGRFAVHVPGSNATWFASQLWTDTKYGKALVGKMAEANTAARDLLRERTFKYDTEEILRQVKENRLAARPWNHNLNGGKQWQWRFAEAGFKADAAYARVHDILNQLFGSRLVEPRIHEAPEATPAVPSSSREAAIKTATGADVQRITRKNTELYTRGQAAVTSLLSKLQARFDVLNRHIKNIAKYSNIAHGYQLRMRPHVLPKIEARLAEVEARLGERLPYDEHRALQTERWQLLNRKAEVERWDTPEHTGDDAFAIQDLAFDYLARGAGKEIPAELRPAVDEYQALFNAIMDESTAQERIDIANWLKSEDVNQKRTGVANSMFAVARLGEGNSAEQSAILSALDNFKNLQLNGDFERLQALADERLHAVGGFKALVEDLGAEGLTDVLEPMLKIGGPVGNRRDAVKAILERVIPDEGMRNDLLGRASVISGTRNVYDAVVDLANMMRDGTGELNVQAMAKQWAEEELTLRRLSTGEYTEDLRKAAVKSTMASAVARRVARLRGRVGADDWDAFLEWASTGGRDVPAWDAHLVDWRRIQAMAAVAADARGGGIALLSGLKTELSTSAISRERLARAMGEAGGELKGKVRKALDKVLDVEKPIIAALADDIADLVAGRELTLLEPERVIAAASANAEVRSLEQRLADVEPHFVYPKSSELNPPEGGVQARLKMNDFEARIFDEMQKIQAKYDLSREDMFTVGMSALVNAPQTPGLEWRELAKRWEGVFGTRFQPVPEELVEPMFMAQRLIKSYEEAYIREGLDILKSPVRLMYEEGLAEWAPKIVVKKSELAADVGKLKTQARDRSLIYGGIDQRLSTKMDAARRRKSLGTVEELKAWANEADENTYSYRPQFLLARYLQSNRALSSKEFLDELVSLKVARSYGGKDEVSRHVAAEMDDYVPLFTKGDEAWAGWMFDLPEVREAYKIESYLADRTDLEKSTIDNLVEMGQWQLAAEYLQEKAGKVVLAEEMARYYGEDSIRRLYVPRSFHQSLHDVFRAVDSNDPVHDLLVNSASFYKPWLTVLYASYHGTNAFGNLMMRILDQGVVKTFDPVTLATAGRLHAASVVADNWGGGSLTHALEHLADRGPGGPSAVDRLRGEAYVKLYKLDKVAKTGIDLGDGVLRPADESLRILRENGVTQMMFNHQIDVGEAEALLAEQSLGRAGKLSQAARNAYPPVRDIALIAAPYLAAGHVTNPLVLPTVFGFKLGETIGKTIENQARLTNFVASMRRVPSIQEAAANVQRLYFNYLDLTAAQRIGLRVYFPLSTWPLKNAQVQMERMTRNPAFYSWLSRLMMDTLPRMSQAYEADEEGTEFVPHMPMSERTGLQSYGYGEFRIPVPKNIHTIFGDITAGEHATLRRFQTPQEAFVGSLGDLTSFADNPLSNVNIYGGRSDMMRVVGQTHILIGFAIPFLQDSPSKRLQDGTKAYELLGLIKAADSIPVVGHIMARNMTLYSGLIMKQEVDMVTKELKEVPYAPPGMNFMLTESQLSRLLAEVERATHNEIDYMAAELLNEEAQDAYGVPYDPDVSPFWKGVDSMLGPQVEIENPETRRLRMERNIIKSVEDEGAAYKALDKRTEYSIKP